jgi:hypothetical protein
MNPSKINELFDTLRRACTRQFAFNPRRVTEGMRYVGKEGHGKDLVHIFRDVLSHSQIVLKDNFVSLRETHGDKAHWSDAEKARYQHSDAEIDAELRARQAELDYTRNCALYQDHRDELLSHYNDWPGFKAGGPTPGEAAKALIARLAEADDSRLAEFAEHVQSSDRAHLAHALLAPCHAELEGVRAAAKAAHAEP